MPDIHEIELEIVRPGPTNNQLLSPLTQYMALCGESAPTTFTIDLQHHELISKISRLRYTSTSRSIIGATTQNIPDEIRASTMSELGKDLSKILESLKPLLVEQWKAVGAARAEQAGQVDQQRRPKSLIHIRLVASGSELAILPFELATAPDAYPAEGGDWLLDPGLPVVLTREVRKSRFGQVSWKLDKAPKLLIAIAAPGGSTVPAQEHINAITAAISPWVSWPDDEVNLDDKDVKSQRLSAFEKSVHIIHDASLEKIRKKCLENEYSHIHVLAHGGDYQATSDQRYGVVLCDHNNPKKPCLVSGDRIAKVLTRQWEGGIQKSPPKFVCLATCDSGNMGSVYTPGGSVAYDLHIAGIPWVVASQFPLTKRGSVVMVRGMYKGLFAGEDPRLVLDEVRKDLHAESERNHDWSSILAYASLGDDFDEEVNSSLELQARRRIETSLARIDNLEKQMLELDSEPKQKRAKTISESALEDAKHTLEIWATHVPPDTKTDMNSRSMRSEYYGMCGAKCKRESLMCQTVVAAIDEYKVGLDERDLYKNRASECLAKASEWYMKGVAEKAYDCSRYHWTATQALSLMAISKRNKDPLLFNMCSDHAEDQARTAQGLDKCWAHCTLVELAILEHYHTSDSKDSMKESELKKLKMKVENECKEIVKHCPSDKFPIESTLRQFGRYKKFWRNNYWDDAVAAGFAVLEKALPR